MNAPTARSLPKPPPHRPLRTILLAAGSVVLLALIVGAILIVGAAASGKRSDASARYSITGSFDSVRVNAESADVTVRYADVDATEVIFHQGTQVRVGTLHHTVADGTLTVTEAVSGSRPFSWLAADATTLEIILPESNESTPLGVHATIQSGNLELSGRFAALTIASNAGDVTLSGGARSLDLKAQSGNVTATSYAMHGPVTATTVAGDSRYDFSSLPTRATFSTSAGDIWLTLPKGSYRVTGRTRAGTVHQGVTNTPGASRAYTLHDDSGNITVANG